MPVPVPVQVTPPEGLIVPVADVADHARADVETEEGSLVRYLKAATRAVERFTRRQLLTAAYRIRFDGFPAGHLPIVLPRPPLVSVEEVTYTDASNQTQTLDPSAYVVRTDRFRGQVEPAYGTAWPQGRDVTITFVAGYGNPEDVPEDLRLACCQLAAEFYRRREVTTDGGVAELPFGVKYLCMPYRVETP
jgi:uncharacterized phiE125 gp8 family phage protein